MKGRLLAEYLAVPSKTDQPVLSALSVSQNPLRSMMEWAAGHPLVSGSVRLGGRKTIDLHKLPGGADTADPEATHQRPLDRQTLRAFLNHCYFRATSSQDLK